MRRGLVEDGIVVETVAVDLGVGEQPDQVGLVAGASPVLNHRPHVGAVGVECPEHRLDEGGVLGAEATQEIVGPAEEVGAVPGLHTQEVADDDHRSGAAMSATKVAAAACANPVDDLVDHGGDRVLEGAHTAGG